MDASEPAALSSFAIGLSFAICCLMINDSTTGPLLTRVDAKLRSHSSIRLSLERGERRAERDEWLELAERAFQIKVRRLRVLAYMAALPAAGDRSSNTRLMKEPGNCDLSDGRTKPFRDRTYSVGDGEAPLDFPRGSTAAYRRALRPKRSRPQAPPPGSFRSGPRLQAVRRP